MSAQTLQEVRSRLVQVAVDLGWTPPGWRQAPYPPSPRVIDRLGDLALGSLVSPADSGRDQSA